MNRKPDVIRSLVIIFVMGLLISGFTRLGASERTVSAQLQSVPQYEAAEESNWRVEIAQ